MSTLAYWLHVLFDPYVWDANGRCHCWICKVVKWKS